MLTWHECSETFLFRKKTLFSCHVPSALIWHKRIANMPSALGTKKYITYFFCDRFVLRPLPALRKIWAHDMRSPAHLKRKNKTGQETCVCPMTYDIFRSRDIHKYVITYTLATLKSCACTCVGSKPRSCHLLNVWGKKKKDIPMSSDPQYNK